jgi:dTDP-4-dehydrorhamnose 3,5-epimerase-like enzyme
MRIEQLRPAHEDERGLIMDLLARPLTHVALMMCEDGAVRGNHYHRTATAYVFVLTGGLNVCARREGEEAWVEYASAWSLITIEPGERFSLTAIGHAEIIEMIDYRGEGQHFERDTVQEAP